MPRSTCRSCPWARLRQAGGKQVLAYAAAFDIDPDAIVGDGVEIEWPRRSSRKIMIPEIDAARWLPIEQAREVMLASELSFPDRLEVLVSGECVRSDLRGEAAPH